MNDSVSVAVYSTEKLGIMAVAENQNPADFLDKLVLSNSDTNLLTHQFTTTEGTKIEFDVNCPKDRWVIQAINGKPVDRKYDYWPLIQGDFLKTN